MSWRLTSSRPVHWPRLLLGPSPKIPAWINMPPGLWKPLITTFGRTGRIFSRRIAAVADWIIAWLEAISGRLVSAIGINSSSVPRVRPA